ncbi:ABC transporter ATP-binding protein [Pediococcus acidilactici]|uniref:ABC transporter ATP-binding protein n=1 Tax=Pediococcus acidilactici TaxID=1254 RepID=UPI00232A8B79|nr:ATP-binding cassette domain-containing protein [Pediococcus acidilactici]MDB8858673.1 ATP-binding cassette domain-containing protein [Pediococcus acidilactici]MDB8860963.1 ATP-binding cassette domain-containing protein [Pediococcus acidilactici]MDB8862145.1 ATP-binding cassette domain-containing protein [Pediococcus acidilactici]MDB8865854.1 ATP-binding cassette domain-containing protein [Pediococcus acidilactici]
MTKIFSVRNLNYVVNGTRILNSIDFDAELGDYVTIIGPSGSGKSTFLKILATLLTPTSGTIMYHGEDQLAIPKIEYRKEVSYCFQQPTLFGETVRDNLAFPFEIRNHPFNADKAVRSLEQVDLTARFLDKPIVDLSGGEKQRVALVRNLLFPPNVLLLDEVTTGLDVDTKAIVHQLIEKMNQKSKITVLAITHDEAEIGLAHRLVTIENGRIVGERHELNR